MKKGAGKKKERMSERKEREPGKGMETAAG